MKAVTGHEAVSLFAWDENTGRRILYPAAVTGRQMRGRGAIGKGAASNPLAKPDTFPGSRRWRYGDRRAG